MKVTEMPFDELVKAILQKYGNRKEAAQRLGYKTVQGFYSAERVGRFSQGRLMLIDVLLNQPQPESSEGRLTQP
ncbi:MAG: hypothetical protein JEY79_01125 [Pseudodesulfovibrio sp.]|nr:hypothetical protein [Pseudodesulfovibrio sp.]